MKEIIAKKRIIYFITVLMGLTSAILMALFAIRLGALIDVVQNNDGSLIKKVIECLVIITAWFISSFIFSYVKSKYASDILKETKKQLYSSMYRKELNKYVEEPNEYYLNIFTKKMDIFNENYLGPRCDIVFYALSALVSIGVIFWIDWKLGAAFVGVSLITIVLSQLPGVIMAKKTGAFTSKSADYLKVVNNHLHGFEQIKLLGVSRIFLKEYLNTDAKFEKTRQDYMFTSRLANNMGVFFSFFAQLSCMAVGLWFVLKGDLTIGLLISSIQLLNGVFQPIQMFAHNKNLMGTVKDIFKEVDMILDGQGESGETFLEPVKNISIRDLTMKFNDEKVIFDHFNMEFQQGKKYAIVGESGRGKSTLVKLIMKYYSRDAYSGEIKINDKNIDQILSSSLYKKIAYIQRNDFYVSGTVEDNIVLKRDINEGREGLYQKLKLSEKLLEKQVESGSRNQVSTGEKQRIDIARFLVRDYDLLIFDEPTSNLDMATSELIFDMIFSLKDMMVIVITHVDDPEILGKFDEVIHL